MEYKSYRYVDGKARWIIVDIYGKIINKNHSTDELKGLQNEIYKYNVLYTDKELLKYLIDFVKENGRSPTMEDIDNNTKYPGRTTYKTRFGSWNKALMLAELYSNRSGNYNSTNTCDRCRERGITEKLVKGKAYREYREGKSTGYWLCNKCYAVDYHFDVGHSKSSRRTGDLADSRHIFADNCQELTCIWRSTISTIPVENLNEKLNNHKTPIDNSYDSELGILQTKGCSYSSKQEEWSQKFDNEHGQIVRFFVFDNLILYCVSENGKNIDRLYIFPFEEILNRSGICIYNNDGCHWYEQYRITDEEELKRVNDIWQRIINKSNK